MNTTKERRKKYGAWFVNQTNRKDDEWQYYWGTLDECLIKAEDFAKSRGGVMVESVLPVKQFRNKYSLKGM